MRNWLAGIRYFLRNLAEFALLFAWWGLVFYLQTLGSLNSFWLAVLIVGGAWAKSLFFGVEDLQELWQASVRNVPYYQFLLVMLVNMSQIVTSFALDFHCLQVLRPGSLGAIPPDMRGGELLFECFYYSVLNFTFFGYGDVTPQTIAAKLVTMTEIVLAFVTVIFLLSDFISLKESLIRRVDPGSPRDL